MNGAGATRWTWRIGRGRAMARMRGRRAVAPSSSIEDRLDDASRYTARYDAVTDWSDGRGTLTEKLMVSSWTLRYWRAGARFRARMMRSAAILLISVAAAIGLFVLIS